MKLAAAFLVLTLFCAPLFIGLGRTDFRGDEPIYAFAVDELLKNGDWLTPRSIPYEGEPFLEKPPLKFWIVAAPMRAGILPQDEFGHRFWDALFGAAAFLYVFAISVKLGGPLCGLVAVFTLFIHGPLLYEHGIRSNNMEAPLLFAYCGGVYHLHAWSVARDRRRRRLHPQAFAGFFVLGFMTKFVAALFLPFVALVTVLAFAEWRRRFLEDWRIWTAAAILVVAATTPWFIYQTILYGRTFWRVLVAEQVVMRMSEFVDPKHVEPWHFYASSLYTELARNRTLVPIVAGLLILIFETIRRRLPLGTLILCWFFVPTCVISFGNSKLYHYLYPFLPPLGIAAGYFPVALLRRTSVVRRALEDAGERVAKREWLRRIRARAPRLAAIAAVVAVVAFAIAVVTFTYGRFGIHIGDVTLFRNSSIARPLVVSIVLFLLAGRGALAGRWALAFAWLLTQPLDMYPRTIEHLNDSSTTFRTLRTCLTDRATAHGSRGFWVHPPDVGWPYEYYFRHLGVNYPNQRIDSEVVPLLFDEAQQRPVLLTSADVARIQAGLAGDGALRLEKMARVQLPDGLQLLLPGDYAICAGTSGADRAQR